FASLGRQRDLHSFPTRRSSDLEEEADYLGYLPPILQNVLEYQEIAKAVNPEIIALKQAVNKVLNEQFIQSAEDTLEWREEEFKIDRKSTRLNSSHVKISYAVFC